MTDDYVCDDPECTEDLAWHLINGDLDCLDHNRDALATFAFDATHPKVTVYLVAEGFEDGRAEVDMKPAAPTPAVEDVPDHRTHETHEMDM
jgi:hypothetical protein